MFKKICMYVLSFAIPPAGIVLFFINISKDKKTAISCLIWAALSVAGAFVFMAATGLL